MTSSGGEGTTDNTMCQVPCRKSGRKRSKGWDRVKPILLEVGQGRPLWEGDIWVDTQVIRCEPNIYLGNHIPDRRKRRIQVWDASVLGILKNSKEPIVTKTEWEGDVSKRWRGHTGRWRISLVHGKTWLPSAATETWGWQALLREMLPVAQEFTALHQKATATIIFTKPNHATLRPTRLRKAMT